jgi:predicted transcriptional regulator
MPWCGVDTREPAALRRHPWPQASIGPDLAQTTGRSQPNLTRTLAKLEGTGFVKLKTIGRRKAPSVSVKRIVIENDPCSSRDLLRVA